MGTTWEPGDTSRGLKRYGKGAGRRCNDSEEAVRMRKAAACLEVLSALLLGVFQLADPRGGMSNSNTAYK